MKPWVVALGLYRSSGGPAKTIDSFRKALDDAPMLNFVDPLVAEREESAMEGATIIQASSLPGFRQFCYPSPKQRVRIEKELKIAPLISCHSFYRYHNLWTLRMRHRYGVPYWFVPHGGLDPYVMQSDTIAKRAFLAAGGKKFLDDASCIVFSTEAEWRKAETTFGPLQGEVVPWPVEIPKLADPVETRHRIRRSLGIPPGAVVVLYFGRLHSMKQPLETISLVHSLKRDDVHLLMVGPDGDLLLKDCNNLARKLGFGNLHVTGPLFGHNKLNHILAADFYISLSYRENFNHSAAECLALGIPVLLSSGNDLGEFIQESASGKWIQDDSPSMFDALVEFCDMSPQERVKMGENGKLMVEAEFSFSRFKKTIQSLVKRYGK
ncbi:MAG: glycosyltransferase [Kiritimatiellia bacterium]